MIPAALITGLRSDLPGEVTAQVTQDVYDSPTGTTLLIPEGARLAGQYDAQMSFGQTRALLVWTRLIMPNGRSIVLERQPATDTQGYAGLEDEVDNHWGMLFKAAILSTLLSVGSEAGTGSNENSLVQAIRQGSSQGFNQVGEQVVGRSLNVQPTITIRPGFPVRVLVTRDLVFGTVWRLKETKMAKLKLGTIESDKPVKLTIALPAPVHRDLVAYAQVLARETEQNGLDPAQIDCAHAGALHGDRSWLF